MLAVVAVAGGLSLAILRGFRAETAWSLRRIVQVIATAFIILLVAGPMFAFRDTLRGRPPSTPGEILWLAQSVGWCGFFLIELYAGIEFPLFWWYETGLGIISLACLVVQVWTRRGSRSWASFVGLLIGLIPGILAALYVFFGIG